MELRQNVNIKKIETNILNGRKINIKITLEICAKIYSNEEISLISNMNNIEDIQILSNQKIINSFIAAGSTTVNAKDTISIDTEDDIAEIMKVTIKIVDKDIKISYNKVLAKAQLDVSIMYLTEDSRIKNISYKIPIMGFIDIENISEDSKIDINYCVKNLIIKPNSSDLNSIYVEAEIEIECSAYQERTISLIEDLYSISQNLNYKQKEITTMCNKQEVKDVLRINDSIELPEIQENKLYNVQTNPVILNYTIKNGKVLFEGELNLELIYEEGSRANSKKITIPFTFEMISEYIRENTSLIYEIEIKREDFIVNGANIDINIDLEFILNSFTNEKINVIDEITSEEISSSNLYSMVIYFVRPNDTLWKIAKRFKSTVEDIARVNGIEDVNILNIGQQLYIPKFINKKIAV